MADAEFAQLVEELSDDKSAPLVYTTVKRRTRSMDTVVVDVDGRERRANLIGSQAIAGDPVIVGAHDTGYAAIHYPNRTTGQRSGRGIGERTVVVRHEHPTTPDIARLESINAPAVGPFYIAGRDDHCLYLRYSSESIPADGTTLRYDVAFEGQRDGVFDGELLSPSLPENYHVRTGEPNGPLPAITTYDTATPAADSGITTTRGNEYASNIRVIGSAGILLSVQDTTSPLADCYVVRVDPDGITIEERVANSIEASTTTALALDNEDYELRIGYHTDEIVAHLLDEPGGRYYGQATLSSTTHSAGAIGFDPGDVGVQWRRLLRR